MLLARSAADRQLDAKVPDAFFSTKRTRALIELALQAATERWSDDDALSALVAAGDRKTLRRAAAEARSNRFAVEHRNEFRAARLLEAASAGVGPKAPSPEDEALFSAVEGLEGRSLAAGFDLLASEVPSLRVIASAALAERPDDARAVDGDARAGELISQLEQLLGPDAHGSALVRSHVALDWGRRYVVGLAGLLVDDDDSGHAET